MSLAQELEELGLGSFAGKAEHVLGATSLADLSLADDKVI